VNLKTRIVTIKTIIEMMERIGIPEKLKTYIEAAKKDVDKLEQELGIKVR
jgi:alcohol dehydrogenase class IV